jgi:hypothetical protein
LVTVCIFCRDKKALEEKAAKKAAKAVGGGASQESNKTDKGNATNKK